MSFLKFKTLWDNVFYKKEEKLIYRKIVNSIIGLILLFLFWLIVGLIILFLHKEEQFKKFLPVYILKEIIFISINSFFWASVVTSMVRILLGLFFAIVIGVPLGLLIGFYRRLREFTSIPIHFIRMISPISWMPLAIIILPGFDQAIIFLIFISTVWPVLLNSSEGVLNVKPEWIRMAENQGAKDSQLIFRIVLPASLPYILNGIRLAVGVAWIVLIPAEMLGVTTGLGYLINDARDTLSYDRLVALVLMIGLLGFILDSIFQYIQKRLDWRNR